jgi:hypothetical protein
MSGSEEINRALIQALACREGRKRGEQVLETLRRKENNAQVGQVDVLGRRTCRTRCRRKATSPSAYLE